MAGKAALRAAIESAAQSWPRMCGPSDPNTIDVYWHAGEVVKLLALKLPIETPQKKIGVALVECVEKRFISGSLIRQCSPHGLAERAVELIKAIRDRRLLSIEVQESYAVALYTWHGCINMAKLLRRTYVVPGGEAPYTLEMRLQGHNWLQECWRREEAKGNPWVRYGVSLARLLEKERGNPIVENWVPRDSSYWYY